MSAGSDGKFPHPLRIAESLAVQSEKIHNISFTPLGLIKFLLYGDYLKAKAPVGGASLKPLVQEDLSKYGYKPKDPFEVKQIPLDNGSYRAQDGCILGASHRRHGPGWEIQLSGGSH